MNKITFCINTSKNEKDYVALLMESLLNGIDVNLHNIMIFVDSDNQNSTEMLIEMKPSFPNLTIVKNNGNPIGYASNINWLFTNAKTDIVSYIQSDQIVCLNYDKKLLSHITDNRILCSTRVEPPLHSQSDNEVTYVRNFGFTPKEFKYEDFLRFAEANKQPNKLTNYFFAPFTLYKHLWNNIGGHDVSFIKSREDSDIALRFALKGYELKQTWEAIVYHFTCTSSRGIEWWKPENQERDRIRQENDMKELTRFKEKWGEFLHVSRPQDAERLKQRFLTTNPAKLQENIYATNPPIDETKLTFL
jgi:GT2 family glycosyltransferase